MIMSKEKEVEKTMDMIEKKVGKSLISLVVPASSDIDSILDYIKEEISISLNIQDDNVMSRTVNNLIVAYTIVRKLGKYWKEKNTGFTLYVENNKKYWMMPSDSNKFVFTIADSFKGGV
jgi:hypothetical protein